MFRQKSYVYDRVEAVTGNGRVPIIFNVIGSTRIVSLLRRKWKFSLSIPRKGEKICSFQNIQGTVNLETK